MPRRAPEFAGTLKPEIHNRGPRRQSPPQERFVDGSKLAEAGRRPAFTIRQFIAGNGHRPPAAERPIIGKFSTRMRYQSGLRSVTG